MAALREVLTSDGISSSPPSSGTSTTEGVWFGRKCQWLRENRKTIGWISLGIILLAATAALIYLSCKYDSMHQKEAIQVKADAAQHLKASNNYTIDSNGKLWDKHGHDCEEWGWRPDFGEGDYVWRYLEPEKHTAHGGAALGSILGAVATGVLSIFAFVFGCSAKEEHWERSEPQAPEIPARTSQLTNEVTDSHEENALNRSLPFDKLPSAPPLGLAPSQLGGTPNKAASNPSSQVESGPGENGTEPCPPGGPVPPSAAPKLINESG